MAKRMCLSSTKLLEKLQQNINNSLNKNTKENYIIYNNLGILYAKKWDNEKEKIKQMNYYNQAEKYFFQSFIIRESILDDFYI